MTGKVDENAVVGLGDRREPIFQLMTNVRQSRLGIGQNMNVFSGKVSALLADQGRVHGFGITVGILKLCRCGQVLIVGNTNDQGIAAWHDCRGRSLYLPSGPHGLQIASTVVCGLRRRRRLAGLRRLCPHSKADAYENEKQRCPAEQGQRSNMRHFMQ